MNKSNKESIMRLTIKHGLLFVALIATALPVFAQQKQAATKGAGGNDLFVQPTSDKTPVYKNSTIEMYEEPVYTVGTNDRLVVLQTKGQKYQVKNSEGKIGWIERRLTATSSKSKSYIMDEASVMRYLDQQTPIYIMDNSGPSSEAISLDRSFKDEQTKNVDRETVERQTLGR